MYAIRSYYELQKDVSRLEKITERFSKIGARPSLVMTDICQTVSDSLDYLRSRGSDQILFEFEQPEQPVLLPLNETLFSWVIENLCKNSMDAIEGKGTISVRITSADGQVMVDVADSYNFV